MRGIGAHRIIQLKEDLKKKKMVRRRNKRSVNEGEFSAWFQIQALQHKIYEVLENPEVKNQVLLSESTQIRREKNMFNLDYL